MAHRTGVVSCDGVALDVAAGRAAGIGRNGGIAVRHGITVHIGGVVRLPLDTRERQSLAVLLNGFGEVLRVLLGEVWVAAFGRDLLRGTAIAGRFDLHGIKSERQGPDEAIVCDEFLFLR